MKLKLAYGSIFLIGFIYFSLYLYADNKLILFTDKVLAKIQAEHGDETKERFLEWGKFIEDNQDKSEKEKIELVNDFLNQQLKWVEDNELWKKEDYWATPIETLIKKAGDCEDFTIIKYFSLIALGVPVKHLKLAYVIALDYDQPHMVLIYAKTRRSIPLVLDNINKKILPATERKDLRPIYSFNGQGKWLQKKKYAKKAGSSNKIHLWVDLNERMELELL